MFEVDHPAEFRAMGTRIRVFLPPETSATTADRIVLRVRGEFDAQERRFSRFRADSELSAVNATAGATTAISPTFREVAELALRAAADSRGRFDPTVLGALVAAGYDRDFDDLVAGARDVLHPVSLAGRWGDVVLGDETITLPPAVGLDLGGIVKGWTCDRAAEASIALGAAWVLVDAGGDLRVAGDAPTIAVGVEDPDDPERGTFMRVGLDRGALATSCVTRRRWGPDAHHLIDPSTSLPARTGVAQATAWAPSCAEAEVAAKHLLLVGEEALDRIPGVLVLDDGRVVTSLAAAA